MSKRKFAILGGLIIVSVLVVLALAVWGWAQQPGVPLAALLAGNDRFIAGASARTPVTTEFLRMLAQGQHPSAVIVACSDSRVAPELIFDRSLGQIFVVRTAGNVLDNVGMGSVEYAVEHLHTPLILVMGHQYCGAVMAAMGRNEEGGTHPVHLPNDHIGSVLALLAPAVKTARAAHAPNDAELLELAIRANVHNVVLQLQRDPVLIPAVQSNSLSIIGAEYMLDTGKVVLLPEKR